MEESDLKLVNSSYEEKSSTKDSKSFKDGWWNHDNSSWKSILNVIRLSK